MTKAELESLERLITAAKNSVFVRLTAKPAEVAEYEALVRRVATEGLTHEEAVKVIEALDTEAEVQEVKGHLNALVNKTDSARLVKWLERAVDEALSKPDIEPAPVRNTFHCTTFLRKNASITSHVLLSKKLSDAQRQELIDFNKAQGYTVFYVYAANEGDYGGKSVNYTDGDKAFWRKWLRSVVDSGARVIMWGCADDSAGLSKRTATEWQAYWGAIHAACGDLISEWVTGLECDERWTASYTQTLTKLLKALTNKPVGVHTTGISKISYANGADAYYLQTGFGKTPAQVADLVQQAKSRFGGRVIAAEYHKSGESDEAKRIGDAAIKAGADGVGNGCNALASVPVEPPTTGGLTFKYVGTGERDVSWSPSVDRSGWPIADNIKGKPNGLLYGARKGEEPRKIEWIKRGESSAHTKNAWDYRKDPKYNQGWVGGEDVVLEVRDTTGKLRSQGHAGPCKIGKR